MSRGTRSADVELNKAIQVGTFFAVPFQDNPARAFRAAVVAALLAVLAACSTPPEGAVPPGGVYDPYERGNRNVHAFNVALDRAFLRPASKGYSTILPDEIEDSIGNFAENLSMPGVAVNGLLQGDLRTAGLATARFAINTVLGIGGFFDPASDFDVPEADTDFGETLYVWGVQEGAYIELPFLGPSTERDTAGRIVDLFTNPLTYALQSPEDVYPTVANVASRLSDRGRYSDTVDSILYDSADSYAQSQLIYMQNRRFRLGQTEAAGQIDPFALDTEGF
jgi:phospholipid-binding lipoprotein MlaA